MPERVPLQGRELRLRFGLFFPLLLQCLPGGIPILLGRLPLPLRVCSPRARAASWLAQPCPFPLQQRNVFRVPAPASALTQGRGPSR